MSAVGIIYGDESGIIRRFVEVDDVTELAGHYGKGEAITIVDAAELMKNGRPDLAKGIAIVAEKRGKQPEGARCLVIDEKSGEIDDVILADPVLDVLSGKILYQHAEAAVGWSLDAKGEFVAPVAEVEESEALDAKPGE